jgi:hypothetical protein
MDADRARLVCNEVFAVSLAMRRLQEREIALQIGL